MSSSSSSTAISSACWVAASSVAIGSAQSSYDWNSLAEQKLASENSEQPSLCFQTNFPQIELLNRQTFCKYYSENATEYQAVYQACVRNMTSRVEMPLRKLRAQLEPIASNGGRKFSLFKRRNFNEGKLFIFNRAAMGQARFIIYLWFFVVLSATRRRTPLGRTKDRRESHNCSACFL